MKSGLHRLLLLASVLATPTFALDTDGDGFSDSYEDAIGTDKTLAADKPIINADSPVYAFTSTDGSADNPSASVPNFAYRQSHEQSTLQDIFYQLPSSNTVYIDGTGPNSDWGVGTNLGSPPIILDRCNGTFELALDPFSNFTVAGTNWTLDTVAGRGAASIDGTNAVGPSEAWLIADPVTIPTGENLTLNFDYFKNNSDNIESLAVFIGTAYSSGDPNAVSWTNITPANLTSLSSNTWHSIPGISITGIDGTNVRIALRYTSSGDSSTTARFIAVDNVCLVQNIYLPPEVTSFTANNIQLAGGEVFRDDVTLEVSANNFSRIGFAEFAYRPLGGTLFTTLGEDTRTSNGLFALWPISQIPDGDYELAARLWNGSNFTESIYPVSIALETPPAPNITSPGNNSTTENLTQLVTVTGTDGNLLRLFQNGSEIGSGRPANGSPLSFTADLPLGDSTFTATSENRAGTSPSSSPVLVTREKITPILNIALNDSTLIEGDSLEGTVSLQSALLEDLTVTLSSSRSTEVNPGPPVIITAGMTSAPFTIQGIDDERIEFPIIVGIEASAPRATTKRANLTLLDNDIPILTFTANKSVVSESDGQGAITFTLTRDKFDDQLEVTLTNSDDSELIIPATITFAPGQDSLTFTGTAVDDLDIDGTQTTNVQVFLFNNNQVISQSLALPIEVSDNEGPALELIFNQSYVLEGENELLTVRRLGGDQNQPLTVTLVSSDPSELTLPATIEFTPNQSETTTTLTGVVDTEALDSTAVTVTASATDHSTAQVPVLVVDQTLPDLIALNLNSETTVESEDNFQVSYDIENQGRASTGIDFVQGVYFSRDTAFDSNDILLRESPSPGPLDEGITYSRTLTCRAPTETGTFYLLVVTDSSQIINEISESNNVAVFPQTIEVSPAYTATIEATLDAYPIGSPVSLTGSLTKPDGTTPATFSQVNIHIRTAGTERIISAISDAFGNFSTNFIPLPGEGGDYELGATHPGITTAPTQDTFSILTFNTDFANATVNLDEGTSSSIFGNLFNPTSFDFTNVTFEALDLPPGLIIDVTLPDPTLPANSDYSIRIDVTADPGSFGSGTIFLRATSDQGFSVDIPIELVVNQVVPILTITPESLNCSVLRGSQKIATFTIENTGGAPTGEIDLALPPSSWINLIGSGTLPSLAPGESADVSIALQPADNQALTQTTGSIAINPAAGNGRLIPFAFRVVSDLRGDLEIEAVDEAFFYTEDAPRVEGALVIVRDPITAEQVAEATTTSTGIVTFPSLTEGFYQVEVSSPDHSLQRGNIFVNAGELTSRQIFISRNVVTYNWTVEEIEIQDTYRITVETVFETNVPAPVITVSPGAIDVEDLVALGQTKVVNLTVENHGLISTSTGEFFFEEHPFYTFEPLISDVGSIPAKSSLVVPVVVTRSGVFGSDGSIVSLAKSTSKKQTKSGSAPPVGCGIVARYNYGYPCGPNDVSKSSPIAVSGVQGNCDTGSGGGPTGGGYFLDGVSTGGGYSAGGAPGRNNVPVIQQINFPTPTVCDCPFFDQVCLGAEGKISIGSLASKLASQLGKVLPSYIRVEGVKVTVNGSGQICVCCVDGKYGLKGNGKASATVTVDLVAGLSGSGEPSIDSPEWANVSVSVDALAGAKVTVTGTISADLDKPCLSEGLICLSGSIQADGFAGIKLEGSASATLVSGGEELGTFSGEAKGVLGINGFAKVEAKGCSDGSVEFTACAKLEPEATLSLELEDAFGNKRTVGGSLDLPKFSVGCGDGEKSLSSKSLKNTDPNADIEIPDPIIDNVPGADYIIPDNQVLFENYQELFGSPGVCAEVKISVSQDLVMTRSAFRASLELGNNQDDNSLTDVGFELDVRDSNGNPAGEVFNTRITRIEGLSSIDGTGALAPNQSGNVEWTLIPRDTAAPTEDTIYTIGGVIRYTEGGVEFSIPVEDVEITVRPDAQLYLKYFHQRDVFSDDPFTVPREPSVPFNLAVLVENRGAGPANNLFIASAQPEIIENDKGLLIDFEIIATEVAGQNITPTLTADFGTIDPGSSKVGIWYLTSSLQGLFVDYNASFEHVDGLGDARISLLKEVDIFEMNHMVRALDTKDDGLPDFLTNDVSDFNDFPDTIHFSDGGTAPVTVYQLTNFITTNPLPNGDIEVTIGADLAASGWSYLRIPDPGGGRILTSAVRNRDNVDMLPGINVWQTDRTFIGFGRRPRYENILHLLDCDASGTYTFIFSEAPPEDTTAPASSVSMLPANSPTSFPVTWSGTDGDSGVSSYDVYVSVDDGPWTLWLPNTLRTSALYDGVDGSKYDFYSIATDFAGNEESKSPTAEATTMVSIANQMPLITAIPDQTVDEGDSFTFNVRAIDPDGSDSLLRYTLTEGPSGMSIDQLTGAILWATGESDAGRSVDVTVTVADSGIPSQIASAAFKVDVTSINSKPVFEPVLPQNINANEDLVLLMVANDPDVPAQGIAYTLGNNAPEGMSIDETTGLLNWIPDETDSGQNYIIEVLATDTGSPTEVGSTTFAVSVADTPLGPPAFDALPVPLWLVGTNNSLNLSASDPDGTPVTISALTGLLPGTASFSGPAETGSGTFTWDLTGVAPGIYNIDLSATTPGETTNATLTIRVDAPNEFTLWAAENLNATGITNPADYGMFGNPDNDDAINLHEFVYLRNPLVDDFTPISFSKFDEVDPFWNVYILEFLRHTRAPEFVRTYAETSDDLQTWMDLPSWQYQPVVNPNGDHDNNPSTEQVQFQILVPDSDESSNYRLRTDTLPAFTP
ncbi:MAG: putative Ig domain-containing protein [Verrucomicrobiota bacterium]